MYLKLMKICSFLCSLKGSSQSLVSVFLLSGFQSQVLTVLSQREPQTNKQTRSFNSRSSQSGGSTATKIIIKVDGVRIGILEQKSLYDSSTDPGEGLNPFVWKDEHKTLHFFSWCLCLFIYQVLSNCGENTNSESLHNGRSWFCVVPLVAAWAVCLKS